MPSPFFKISSFVPLLTLAATSLIFSPWIPSLSEPIKQAVLLLGVALSLIFFFRVQPAQTRFVFSKSVLVFAALTLLTFFSALLSESGFISWMGFGSGALYSFASILGLCLLFFLLTQESQNFAFSSRLTTLLFLTAFFSLFSALGFYFDLFPEAFALSSVLGMMGSTNTLAYFIAAFVVFLSTGFLHGVQKQEQWLWRLLFLLGLFFLIAVDVWSAWLVCLIGLFVSTLPFWPGEDATPQSPRLPYLLGACAILFLVAPTPFRLPIPIEVTPNPFVSLSAGGAQVLTSAETFFFGEGPGSWPFIFAAVKPLEINQTPFWNLSFSHAYNVPFTLLPTVGVFAALLWLLFVGMSVAEGKRVLRQQTDPRLLRDQEAFFSFFCTLAAASFFSGYSMALALWLLVSASVFLVRKEKTLPLPTRPFFFLSLFFTAAVLFLGVQTLRGQLFFEAGKRAVVAGGVIDGIPFFEKAIAAHPFHDPALRALAEGLSSRVQQRASRAGANPSAEAIAQDMAAALKAASRATELAPANAATWFTRARVERQLSPYASGASTLAALHAQKAVSLDPTNPVMTLEYGRALLVQAQETMLSSKSEDQEEASAMLAEAVLAFEQAVQLKTDYAPAHFELARGYTWQGRLDEAIGKMERVVRYNREDVGAWFELGVLYLRRAERDDVTRADEALSEALARAPSYANALWFLATVRERQGNVAEARALVEQVRALNPVNPLIEARLSRLTQGLREDALPEPLESP